MAVLIAMAQAERAYLVERGDLGFFESEDAIYPVSSLFFFFFASELSNISSP